MLLAAVVCFVLAAMLALIGAAFSGRLTYRYVRRGRRRYLAGDASGPWLSRSADPNGEYIMLKHILTIEAILLLSVSGAAAQMQPGAMEAARACKPDIAYFCGNVPPGQGRIKACMKAHVRELSEPCKEALFQAWLRE